MEGDEALSNPLLEVEKDGWEKTTAQVIQSIEKRCSETEYHGAVTHFGAQAKRTKIWGHHAHPKRSRSKSDSGAAAAAERKVDSKSTATGSSIEDTGDYRSCSLPGDPSEPALESRSDDIRYIDESAKSSICPDAIQPSPQPSYQRSRSHHPSERTCASILEERYCQAFLGPKNDSLVEKHNRHLATQQMSGHHILPKKVKTDSRRVVSPCPLPPEKARPKKDASCEYCSESEFYPCVPTIDTDHQAAQSLFLERDFRYYFQHPYSRLFVSYFVIFCNFLVFAEDPVSHSHTESEIPIVGNVFSFVATKYPPQWSWCVLKVMLWLIAIVSGMICGKYFIHHVILSRFFRLKMFRDEQGTWMIMFLTSLMFIYMFSIVYNFFLMAGHSEGGRYRIDTYMGITSASFMKAAACGTWVGDFITAWMVTDMMLQDNLYPEWAKPYRKFWKSHGRLRIIIFWTGSITMTALVVTLIVSDWISWDNLNRDFVATTELSRAFLASFILVMDLLIVMQDWDFPHFVCDLDIKLPGMHVSSFKFNLFQKYVNIPDVNFHITGKWFNYSIIVFVMILDLNMWKNQIFYVPVDYGQYVGPENKVFSIFDLEVIREGNISLWTYDYRNVQIDPRTNRTFLEGDISMNSRYLGYPLSVKSMAFMPSLIGFTMFGILTFQYGRFAVKSDSVVGGKMRKPKRQVPRSSWRRERGTKCTHYILNKEEERYSEKKKKTGSQLKELIVAWDDSLSPTKACEKPL